jgi:APA family basic amino acid/polyamine antiporter
VHNPSKTAAGGRSLGLWSASALVVGHTIGVGIFLTPAELIGALASPALTLGLWLICGALVLAGALTFGELASRYPLAGGPYIYLREAWGRRIAFLFGWQSLLVMDPGLTAALATGMSGYLVVLAPEAAGYERWLAVGAIWILATIGMAGLTLSTRVLTTLTVFKLAAFVVLVAAAFTSGNGSWTHFRPFMDRQAGGAPLGEALALGLVGVFFSFGGFWEASRIADEVSDASRVMPRALAIGIACVTAVYVAMTAAFIYLVPVEGATNAAGFAMRAGRAMFGEAGASVLAAVVVLSVASSALALLIMAPRLYVAMSRDGLFPLALAPPRATALLASLASLFALVATFQQIMAFFMSTTLAFIALASGALIVVRRRTPRAAFRAPGYPVTVALFVLLIAAVVALVIVNRPVQAVAGFGIVLLGLPAHRMLTKQTRSR